MGKTKSQREAWMASPFRERRPLIIKDVIAGKSNRALGKILSFRECKQCSSEVFGIAKPVVGGAEPVDGSSHLRFVLERTRGLNERLESAAYIDKRLIRESGANMPM
jgi:hypothetical protein